MLNGKTVVVAAADQGSRDAVCSEFKNAGAHVLPVAGGYDAYELARERNVDIVITAARLSNGDPCQLLSDVRRLNHDVPVILFGAAGERINQTEALHRGFSAFFMQAYPSEVLLASAVRSLEFVEERKKKKVERVTVAAEVEFEFGEPPVATRAPVLNLSRGGMFLSVERGFPALQTVVAFKLTFPAEIPQPTLEGKALVRWVRERSGSGHLAGVGMEFVEISDQAKTFLDSYVDRAQSRR